MGALDWNALRGEGRLLLVAPAPGGGQRAVLLLGAAAVLLGMQTWPYRVLDMTNIIGCGVGVVCLLLYYLPFERRGQVKRESSSPGADPAG